VNAVSPGIIKTPMHGPETHEFLANLHPVGRMGEVRDIVDAVRRGYVDLLDIGATVLHSAPRDGNAAETHIGDIHLVVNSQDADAHAVSLATPFRRRGSRTVNSAKSPTSLSTVIVPPCCWVMIS
jgi:hypothetical protein